MNTYQMLSVYLGVGVLYVIWDTIRDWNITMKVCGNIMVASPQYNKPFAAMLISTAIVIWTVACIASWPYQAFTDTDSHRRKTKKEFKDMGLL